VIARARGLNRCVEREQVGLIGYVAHRFGNIADAGRLLA